MMCVISNKHMDSDRVNLMYKTHPFDDPRLGENRGPLLAARRIIQTESSIVTRCGVPRPNQSEPSVNQDLIRLSLPLVSRVIICRRVCYGAVTGFDLLAVGAECQSTTILFFQLFRQSSVAGEVRRACQTVPILSLFWEPSNIFGLSFLLDGERCRWLSTRSHGKEQVYLT